MLEKTFTTFYSRTKALNSKLELYEEPGDLANEYIPVFGWCLMFHFANSCMFLCNIESEAYVRRRLAKKKVERLRRCRESVNGCFLPCPAQQSFALMSMISGLLHLGRLTWNLNVDLWNAIFLYNPVVQLFSGSMLLFPGVTFACLPIRAGCSLAPVLDSCKQRRKKYKSIQIQSI